MMQGTTVNACVFCFCFVASFLLAGKRPILTLSTRAVLVAVVGLAIGYLLSDGSTWHNAIGVAALILNVIFIGFAVIDGFDWHRRQVRR